MQAPAAWVRCGTASFSLQAAARIPNTSVLQLPRQLFTTPLPLPDGHQLSCRVRPTTRCWRRLRQLQAECQRDMPPLHSRTAGPRWLITPGRSTAAPTQPEELGLGLG